MIQAFKYIKKLAQTSVVVLPLMLISSQGLPASDQAKDQSLSLEDVLSLSRSYTPDIMARIADRQAASGAEQAALGQFDMTITANGTSRATGYYGGTVLEAGASQNFRSRGGKIYGKYRISDGTFPIYEDANYTNSLGEFKVGALFAMMRDKDIDANRFGLRDTKLASRQAELDVLLTKVTVQQQAGVAYWRWVMAGYQKRVYERLLTIATVRQSALKRQVQQGAVADIYLLENQQTILRRKGLVATADQRLQAAALQLGYYLRDKDGTMRVPSEAQIPTTAGYKNLNNLINKGTIELTQTLLERPELQRLKVGIQRLNEQVKLYDNALSPRLDLSVEMSRDFGNVAQGGISRQSFDTRVGFQFSFPLGQNTARGKLATAKAKRRSMGQKERMIEEKITINLQRIMVDLKTTSKLVTLARQEASQSRELETAERTRFENGASDFFLLNIREETAANAEIKEINARLNMQTAAINYYSVTMNMKKLYLD